MEDENNTFNCLIRHPARILIFGPSFSGKSTLVSKILRYHEQIFDIPFDRIIFCSGGSELIDIDDHVKSKIEHYESLETGLIDSLNKQQNNCFIIDDFMHRAANDLQVSELFSKRSHHLNTTVIFLLQNIFPRSKYITDIKRNATYIILMCSPSDEKSVKQLSQQYDPQAPNFIYSAYLDATKNKPFSYLLIDMHQQQRNEVRVRNNVVPNETTETFAYIQIPEYIKLLKRIGSTS